MTKETWCVVPDKHGWGVADADGELENLEPMDRLAAVTLCAALRVAQARDDAKKTQRDELRRAAE